MVGQTQADQPDAGNDRNQGLDGNTNSNVWKMDISVNQSAIASLNSLNLNFSSSL